MKPKTIHITVRGPLFSMRHTTGALIIRVLRAAGANVFTTDYQLADKKWRGKTFGFLVLNWVWPLRGVEVRLHIEQTPRPGEERV